MPQLIANGVRVDDTFAEAFGMRATAIVISAIAGKAGVGKTALAVHVAHRLRPRFLDGQLYVNLRGAEAQALAPIDVLAGFLRALRVEGAVIPDGLEERVRQAAIERECRGTIRSAHVASLWTCSSSPSSCSG